MSIKKAYLCSKERTIEGFGLVRAPVFSLFPPPHLSSRGRRLGAIFGFDHGAGHSLLLLYEAKAPEGKKSM